MGAWGRKGQPGLQPMVSYLDCLLCATAPAASLEMAEGESRRKSCQRQTTQQFQLRILVHLKDLTVSFLQRLCLIFLHAQVF